MWIGQERPEAFYSLRVLEGLLAPDTLGRVKREHLGEQIESEGRGIRVEGLELHSGLDRQRSDVPEIMISCAPAKCRSCGGELQTHS